jgi:hypothetical protein
MPLSNASTLATVTRAIHVTAMEVDPATGRHSRASRFVIESVLPAEDLQNAVAGIARGRAPMSAGVIALAAALGLVIIGLHPMRHLPSVVPPTPIAWAGFAP